MSASFASKAIAWAMQVRSVMRQSQKNTFYPPPEAKEYADWAVAQGVFQLAPDGGLMLPTASPGKTLGRCEHGFMNRCPLCVAERTLVQSAIAIGRNEK